jgi:hypothetical protein
MAKLADWLFAQLLAHAVLNSKDITAVALTCRRGQRVEVEHCSHCGVELRVRFLITNAAGAAIRPWLVAAGDQQPQADGYGHSR